VTTHSSRPQSLRAIMGGIIDPTHTEYRGIKMRSRLEADFAHHLDSMEVPWRYEPTMFGPSGSGYLPDFEVSLWDRPGYIEVKPLLRDVALAQDRMVVIWEAYPDAVLIVACAEECRYFAASSDRPWTSWVERWHHS
jgi:hypothetical protein